MLMIDNVISPNKKVTKTTEEELNFFVIKEYIYEDPIHLMLSWRQRNIYYNNYYIPKDEIQIIRINYGESGSYGSIFWARYVGQNTYTGPIIFNREIVTPIQGPILKK